MTDDLVRYYTLAVKELVGALEYLELVAMPGEIERFENALREVTLLTTQFENQLQPAPDAPRVQIPDLPALPILGDGSIVAPAVGTQPIDTVFADEDFRELWRAMAKGGWCDAWGGAECRRVYDQWVNEGRPRDLAAFIVSATCGKRF